MICAPTPRDVEVSDVVTRSSARPGFIPAYLPSAVDLLCEITCIVRRNCIKIVVRENLCSSQMIYSPVRLRNGANQQSTTLIWQLVPSSNNGRPLSMAPIVSKEIGKGFIRACVVSEARKATTCVKLCVAVLVS